MRINKPPSTITREDIDKALEGAPRRSSVEVTWMNVKREDAQKAHAIIRDSLKAHGMNLRFTPMHTYGGKYKWLDIEVRDGE